MREPVVTGPVAAEPAVDEAAALESAGALFQALSEPSRLAILRHLTLGEHRVVDLVAHLDLAQSTVSGHLACLRGCGLVESRPERRSSVFSLRHDSEVLAVLAAAEHLLARTGDAVRLCPGPGSDPASITDPATGPGRVPTPGEPR